METVAAVAPTRATVLIQGESGTGKELIAWAHRGTLLLDEISEMRLDLQPKLLRAIQEQEIERVGGEQPIRVDTRIIATTNRDLRAEVEAGRFREDLFYRLHVVPIRTPPLRERLEDLPMLVEHFAAAAAARLGIRAPRVQVEAIEGLKHRSWPGNIRELANVVERAVILDRSGSLTPGSFDNSHDRVAAHYAGGGGPPTAAVLAARPELALDLAELERLAIQRALLATGGRRATPAMPAGPLGTFCQEMWESAPRAGPPFGFRSRAPPHAKPFLSSGLEVRARPVPAPRPSRYAPCG